MSTAFISLSDVARRLATRVPGRSEATVQSDVRLFLLAASLNLAEDDLDLITLESPAGERRRIDVEVGLTVIEVKRDLRAGNVRVEAEEQLAEYVKLRTQALGQSYVGILTDGAEWRLYHLDPADTLREVSSHYVTVTDPDVEALSIWLESVLATTERIAPTPLEIARRLGADSPAHRLDYADLAALYGTNRDEPGVRLKRELWSKLLTTAFGSNFADDDELFIEHTLLVLSADIIAHAIIGLEPAALSPATILSGLLFDQAQIAGVVEQDFFDWPIEVEGGERFLPQLFDPAGANLLSEPSLLERLEVPIQRSLGLPGRRNRRRGR